MADHTNRVEVDLPPEILNIHKIWMNADEKENLIEFDEKWIMVTDHLSPGDMIVAKIVVRINEDMSWTAFRGGFRDPADSITKHGLLLQESEVTKLFPHFAALYKHPYWFAK